MVSIETKWVILDRRFLGPLRGPLLSDWRSNDAPVLAIDGTLLIDLQWPAKRFRNDRRCLRQF